MWNEALRDLNFIPHHFFLFVRIYLSAVISTYLDLLGQHGESAKRIEVLSRFKVLRVLGPFFVCVCLFFKAALSKNL